MVRDGDSGGGALWFIPLYGMGPCNKQPAFPFATNIPLATSHVRRAYECEEQPTFPFRIPCTFFSGRTEAADILGSVQVAAAVIAEAAAIIAERA